VLKVAGTRGAITDAGVVAVAQRCPLRHLGVAHTGGNVTDEAVIAVTERRQLESLDVSFTHGAVTDAGITCLARPPRGSCKSAFSAPAAR